MENLPIVITSNKGIDIAEPLEVSNWAGKSGVNNARLKSAVHIVGTFPKKVEAYLKRQII